MEVAPEAHMNLGESIRSGTQWLLTGRAFEQGLYIVFGVISSHPLVPEDFGLVATTGIFTGLTTGSLTDRYAAQHGVMDKMQCWLRRCQWISL